MYIFWSSRSKNLYLKIELCLNLRRNVDGVGSRASRSQGSASLRQIAETVISFALQQLNLKPKKNKKVTKQVSRVLTSGQWRVQKNIQILSSTFHDSNIVTVLCIKLTSLEILSVYKTEENLIYNLSYNCQNILWDILLWTIKLGGLRDKIKAGLTSTRRFLSSSFLSSLRSVAPRARASVNLSVS